MPLRPRIAPVAELPIPSADVFVMGPGFGQDLLRRPVYATRAEAERAWRRPGVREYVWARTYRMRIPGGAAAYDGLTMGAHTYLWGSIGITNFDADTLLEALQALAADRGAVDRFEQTEPKAAAAIAPYLRLWREDLDAIEQAAHIRAAHGGLYTVENFAAAHRLLEGSGIYGTAVPGSGLRPVAPPPKRQREETPDED